MKIPPNMPQFSGNTALIVAGSNLYARIFCAKNGTIVLKAALSLSPPEEALRNKAAFSEHELSYALLQKTLAHHPRRKAVDHFARELSGSLSEMAEREKASVIYLLLSTELAASMKDKIGPRVGELIQAIYIGEYGSLEPLGIIEVVRHTKQRGYAEKKSFQEEIFPLQSLRG